ncbi:MAG: hypothetical protein DRP78_04215 [Candidatus Omnitrophota bacterium]|nr:MAG: hypothetical protein DRP78_04215 [Candidatus Omnitrophota bacterium]
MVLIIFILGIVIFFAAYVGYAANAEEKDVVYKIGVLAKRGAKQCLEKWSSTAQYLSDNIDNAVFKIVPLDFDEICITVKDEQVDFIFVNPGLYIELEENFGVQRIVTLSNFYMGKGYAKFGTVIFTRADRKDIVELKDLKNKRFMAVAENAFGGWIIALRELTKQGIDPRKEFKELVFGGIHDAVVLAVLRGEVDAGSVRTEALERMAEEGKINLSDFRIINEKKNKDFSFIHSSCLYPEWPFSKLRHISDGLAKKVSAALLSIKQDDAAAVTGRYYGWIVPSNYQQVRDCYNELRIGIYKDYDRITFQDVMLKYWLWILAIVVLLFTVIIIAFRLSRVNRVVGDREEEYRLLFESSKDAIMTLSPPYWQFTSANEATLRMFGVRGKAAFTALGPWNVAPEKQPDGQFSSDKAKEMIQIAMKNGSNFFEWEHKRMSGEVFPTTVLLTKIEIKEKKYLQATVRDITKEKQAVEKKIEEQEKQFDELRKNRRIALSMMEDANNARKKAEAMQEELRFAKEKAELASKSKSQFLANMSHEIRTPMNAILGFADLLQNTELNNIQKDYVSTLKSSGDLLLALINDILDISKIEAGSVQIEKIGFDLEYLAESVLKIIKAKIRGTDIEFLFEYAPDIPAYFMGDPTRIRQIILNLLSNAVKFTEQGEIKVTVKALKVNAGVGGVQTLELSVKDTGIGIPLDKQEAVFKLFTQADESTTRKFGGTGLGLSISKALAKKMGGGIKVRSEVGKGSEFIVTLQLETAEPVAKKDISLLNIDALKGKRIAIVDDNQNALKLAEAYCRESSMDVVFLTDRAGKILTWLEEQHDLPEIILSDIMMPEMDGMVLAKRIREQDKYSGIKLIAVTSDVRPGSAGESQQAGFDGYLPKPIIRQELIKVIQTTLGDKRKEKEIVTRHTAEELSLTNRPQTDLKGVRVLVVEDQPTNQKLMKVYLNMFGCVSDYANNGQEAVEKIKNNRYDLCLMDIQMPVMGGLEATEFIRKEVNKDIPIIALTAAAMKEDKDKARSSGMNDYLVKPIDHKKLKEMILKWGRGVP